MRTYGQAKEFAQQQHRSGSASWHNICQMFSRQCVGAPPFGASAREAFNADPGRAPAHVQPAAGRARSPTTASGTTASATRSSRSTAASCGPTTSSAPVTSTGSGGTCSRAGGGCPTAAGSRPAPAASCRCSDKDDATDVPAGPSGLRQPDALRPGRLRQRLEPPGGPGRARLRVRERADGLLRRAHPPARRGLPAPAWLDRQRRRRASPGRGRSAALGLLWVDE